MTDEHIKILLVDDDEDDFIITRNLLKESNSNIFDIDWSSDYNSARLAIARDGHDVYLLDYHLGGNTGLDLLREAIRNGCRKPLIIITGKGDSEIDSQALRAGAADFLTKGQIDAALLERSIRYSIEQKLVQRELDAEKERLAVTLRSIGDGVITTDNCGRIELINKTTELLTGWSSAEASSKSIEEIFCLLDDETRDKTENPVRSVLESKHATKPFEHVVLVARDGKEYHIVTSAAPICDRNDEIIGVVLVFHDMTETLKIQAELHNAQRLEALGILAGGIAHDFNNLLTIIVGNNELVRFEVPPDNPAIENLDLINTAAHRAKELTTKFLTFAKRTKPDKKTISIVSVIEESADLCLSDSNIICELSFRDDLAQVDADEGQMSQVFRNLIINAKQAMHDGGKLKIEAQNIIIPDKNLLHLGPGDYIKITVQDDGIGIPKGNIGKIFDPYFTTKALDNKKGTGLGLSTVYAIIKNHHGHIAVDSTSKHGTTFLIYLPVSKKKTKMPVSQADLVKSKTRRILLLDDNKLLNDVVTKFLTKTGHKVIATDQAENAVDLIRSSLMSEHRFDVIIVDLMVSRESVADLVRQVREIDPAVKAIVSSSDVSHPLIVDFKKWGFDAAISKPYKISELDQVLTTL